MSDMATGTEVIVWARPKETLILLLAEGVFAGTTYLNGTNVPVVRLTNGQEMLVYGAGAFIGRKESVAATCKAFKGSVVEWSMHDYLNGKIPSHEEMVRQQAANPNGTPSLEQPKTVTDKLLYMKAQNELDEAKIAMYEKQIHGLKDGIAARRKEAQTMAAEVQNELSKLLGMMTPETIAKAIEEMPKPEPQPDVHTMAHQDLTRPIGGITHGPVDPEFDASKAALED